MTNHRLFQHAPVGPSRWRLAFRFSQCGLRWYSASSHFRLSVDSCRDRLAARFSRLYSARRPACRAHGRCECAGRRRCVYQTVLPPVFPVEMRRSGLEHLSLVRIGGFERDQQQLWIGEPPPLHAAMCGQECRVSARPALQSGSCRAGFHLAARSSAVITGSPSENAEANQKLVPTIHSRAANQPLCRRAHARNRQLPQPLRAGQDPHRPKSGHRAVRQA